VVHFDALQARKLAPLEGSSLLHVPLTVKCSVHAFKLLQPLFLAVEHQSQAVRWLLLLSAFSC
jgi:hypothetical protein